MSTHIMFLGLFLFCFFCGEILNIFCGDPSYLELCQKHGTSISHFKYKINRKNMQTTRIVSEGKTLQTWYLSCLPG